MRGRWVTIAFVVGCGALPLVTQDAGDDGSVTEPDVTTMDALSEPPMVDTSTHDVVDATLPMMDAQSDAIKDVAKDWWKAPLDAPYVDLDAATAPWAVSFGQGIALSVAVDSKQNILVGGYLGVSGYYSAFLEELDSAGNKLWSKNANYGSIYGVAFDPSGNMIAVGVTGGTVDLGGGAIGPGTFVVKYDASGTFVWNYGPFPNTVFLAVATKSNGNIVVGGNLSGSDDYGGGKVTSAGRSAVLVELTGSQSFVQAKTWPGTDQMATALTVDGWDDIFFAGRFTDTIDFGGGSMTGPTSGSGNYNNFIVELDASWTYMQHSNIVQQRPDPRNLHGPQW